MYSKNITEDRMKHPNEQGAYVFSTRSLREYKIMLDILKKYDSVVYDTAHLDSHNKYVYRLVTTGKRNDIDDIKHAFAQLTKPVNIREVEYQ